MTPSRLFQSPSPRLSSLVSAGFLTLALTLALVGCSGSGSGEGGSDGSHTRVTISFGGASAARALAAVPASVRTLRISVQGPGMGDVVDTVGVGGQDPLSVTLSVPSGPDRTFGAEALDAAGVSRFAGSTTTDVFGESLDVAIRLTLAPTNEAFRHWRFLNPTPTAQDLRSIAYGAGTFVAVGASGAVLTSANGGAAWVTRSSDTVEGLAGVAFGDGAFAAVGDLGGVYLSLDGGATWERRASFEGGLRAVTFGSGRFLALGSGPAVLASSDGGRTWASLAQEGLPPFSQPAAAAFGDGAFYALVEVFADGSATALYRSPDGVSWAPEGISVAGGSTGLAYGNGTVLVAAVNGEVVALRPGFDPVSYFITDGIDVFATCFGDGAFAAVGDRGFLSFNVDPAASPVWTDLGTDTLAALRACAAGGGAVVAVGDGGVVVTYDGQATDVPSSSQIAENVGSVGFGNGVFVADAGGGAILRSADSGGTWSPWAPAFPGTVGPLAGFAYGNGAFVAVGPFSPKSLSVTNVPPATPTLYVSLDDGATWVDQAHAVSEDLTAVAFGAGTFVAASANDGLYRGQPPANSGSPWTWTRVAVPDPIEEGISLRGVAFGLGLFVAVGDGQASGRAFVSRDLGQAWAAAQNFSPPSLRHVVFADRTFVALDQTGAAYSSADGLIWIAAGSVPLGEAAVAGLSYGSGVLVAADSSGSLYSSTDNGAAWSAVSFRAPSRLGSVTFGNGVFLAGGDQGIVLASEPL